MKRRTFFKREIIVLIAVSLLSGCSQIKMAEERKEGICYTGNPDIEWATIPGGEYEMVVYDYRSVRIVEGKDIEKTVKLDTFNISKKEITNKQYCMFLNEALKQQENIQVVTNRGELIVEGSTREHLPRETFFILNAPHSRLQNYRSNLSESGIYYHMRKFRVIPGKEDFPVVNVSWSGARAFAEFYSLDLPTEAQWEYAANGGKLISFGTNDGTINYRNANYDDNIGHTVKVGSYPPNEYGLYDMCGNASEWCLNQLIYNSFTKPSVPVSPYALKGGNWRSFKEGCRIRAKRASDRHFKDYTGNGRFYENSKGFRVVTRVINR